MDRPRPTSPAGAGQASRRGTRRQRPYGSPPPLGPNSKPNSTIQVVANNEEDTVGSVGGMYFRQDRVILAQGRMADPNRGDEMVATAPGGATPPLARG